MKTETAFRAASWLAALLLHALILVLVFFGRLFPGPSALVEKAVVMNLSQFVPAEPASPVPPPQAPPVVPPSLPVPAVHPAPQTQPARTPAASFPSPPADEEPDYLPQYKIEQLPQFPVAQILSRIQYPTLAAKQGLEATVILELSIDQHGQIRRIVVLKDPGFGFAAAAIQALQGVQVIPAQSGGKPVAVRYRYPVRFILK